METRDKWRFKCRSKKKQKHNIFKFHIIEFSKKYSLKILNLTPRAIKKNQLSLIGTFKINYARKNKKISDDRI
jgi:hypothetical protein